MQAGRRIIQTMRRFGVDPNYNRNSRLNTSLVACVPSKRDSSPPSKKSAPHCFSCGKKGRYPSQCPQRDHSDRNHDSIPWPESKKGIQFSAFGYSTLPPGMTSDQTHNLSSNIWGLRHWMKKYVKAFYLMPHKKYTKVVQYETNSASLIARFNVKNTFLFLISLLQIELYVYHCCVGGAWSKSLLSSWRQ